MVRGFGALLVVGVGVALAVALTAGTAVLVLASRRRASSGAVARSLRGAGELFDGAARGVGRRCPVPAAPALAAPGGGRRPARLRRPRASRARSPCSRVIPRACSSSPARWRSAGGRWTRGSRSSPSCRGSSRRTSRAVRDLDALQRDTGVAGEVDVLVEAEDLTDPKVIAWMRDYQQELLTRHGYNAQKGCAGGELCPALSLPGPVPHARAVGHARADPRAAGRRAAVLLAGRDHAGPAHRGARVRHPPAVAGGAARGDPGHARAAAIRPRA